jgi:hypothetical protein
MKGIQRAFGKQKKKKLAITTDMLYRMAGVVHSDEFANRTGINAQHVRAVWAAILVGFFGMLRKQNLCSKTVRKFDAKISLIRGDLQWIINTDALWLRARFSKTNQFGTKEHIIPLQHTGGPLCPVMAYLKHVSETTAGQDLGPAFLINKNGRTIPLSHDTFVDMLKQLLAFVGEDPTQFAGHSLRRGGATLGFQLGAPAYQIMAQGDWLSMAVLGYNDHQVEFLQCLPRLMAEATR